MAEIKEFYSLNQKTSAEKYACLNKQKERIAQIDIDIAKFLGASNPVQVYFIRVLVDKHREVCTNLTKKKSTTIEEKFLINQKEKAYENSMQDITYDIKEQAQDLLTRMELEPPTVQLVNQKICTKRKNSTTEKNDNSISKKKKKKLNNKIDKSKDHQSKNR